MSLFGKNIRKIRTVRSMSQQSFAELFDLKRGTLGAYEEGRSEPKIETIIKIANHFSIPIGDLLTKELTVNQLLKFREHLENPDLDDTSNYFTKVPCIIPSLQTDYTKHFENPNFIEDLPFLNIPVHNELPLRGFVIDDLEMSKNSEGFYPKDVVIGEKIPKKAFSDLQSSCLFILISKEKVVFRRLFQDKKKFILKADHRGIDDIEIKHSEVKELWEVKYAFYHRIPDGRNTDIEDKISFLEEQFQKLRSSM